MKRGVRTHGTISCYAWELRQGIPTCDRCRDAAAVMRQIHRDNARARKAKELRRRT